MSHDDRLTAEAVADGEVIADLQTGLVRALTGINERDATIERVKAVCDDWGAGTVHRPRSPYYARLRAALKEPS